MKLNYFARLLPSLVGNTLSSSTILPLSLVHFSFGNLDNDIPILPFYATCSRQEPLSALQAGFMTMW